MSSHGLFNLSLVFHEKYWTLYIFYLNIYIHIGFLYMLFK